MLEPGFPPILLTFVIGTIAAICFGVAALGPLPPRFRAAVAITGVVIDWIPVVAGWMTVEGSPPQVLLSMHFGFGVVGYTILLYCLVGWIRAVERDWRVRVAFIGIWGIAYLAGIGMTVDALLLSP